MPIIMVQEVAADPNGLEQFAAANQETVQRFSKPLRSTA